MSVRAVITDLDGTILPRGGEISPRTVAALRDAGTGGCLRMVATGRNLYSVLQALPPDFPVDYVVFSSGAGAMRWSDRSLLYATHLEEQEARGIAGLLWDYGINFTVQREIPDNHLFYYTSLYPEHEDFRRRVEHYAPFGTCIASPEEIVGAATQFVVILDGRQLRLFDEMRRELSAYSVVRSTSPIDNRALWLEVFAPGVNKGMACSRILEEAGIPWSACAGIGNDYNDTDFLSRCGEAFVVGNAPWQLRERFRTVSENLELGFAEFMQRIGT